RGYRVPADDEVDLTDGPERAVAEAHALHGDDHVLGDARSGARLLGRRWGAGRDPPGGVRRLGTWRERLVRSPRCCGHGHGGFLYHWICLERRTRRMTARMSRTTRSSRSTMIVAAASPWKSACGRLDQPKIWMGRKGEHTRT